MIKKLLVIPIVTVGIVAFVLMLRSREVLPLRDLVERSAAVRVMTVPRTPLVPRATGFGEVRAGRVWKAVPQVSGTIVELSPHVREGDFATAGAVLVRIDRADYDFEVARGEARIAALDAQLREIAMRTETIEASLAIERASLGLADTELRRARELVADNTVSRAELDKEERSVLAQRLRVQEIENTRALLPAQQDVLAAQLKQEAASLARARLAVERTVIHAPFDCRIGPVDVEQDQVVQAGQSLFVVEATDRAEVTAWLPLQGMRRVLASSNADVITFTGFDEIPERLGLTATIRAVVGVHTFEWPASVVRVRGVDSRTRAIGVDVAVEGPYEGVIPGVRPPLVPGLYVQIELRSRVQPGRVVVPRSTVHGGRVRLVGDDGRLELRDVEIAFVQSEHAVVAAGLEGGETLVLSDVLPAVDGLLVTPTVDDAALRALVEDAAGAPPR